MSTTGMRVAGAIMLPILSVGLLAGCGKHSSASSSLKHTYSSSHGYSSSSTHGYSSGYSSKKSSHHLGILSSHSCHPLSKAGNCYMPGQQCAKTMHGESGKAGNGAKIRCVDVRGLWRWES